MAVAKPIPAKKNPAPRLDIKKGKIDLTHGSGGRAMQQLIDQLFIPAFKNPWLDKKDDQACIAVNQGRLVITTDAHVISPLFFPGGTIGSLAVHGTVNDIAMSGATPLYLTASFILEEGLPLIDLEKIVISMAAAAQAANITIIAGDTKVVERGKGDKVFITTTGIGIVPEGLYLSAENIQPKDHIIINGFLGDHGVAIMAHRNNLQFQTTLQSDTAALHNLVATMVSAAPNLRCLRDPTRGGLATVLNEWMTQADLGFYLEESKIPIREAVAGACELLGLDPLYIANEGKLVAICPPEESQQLVKAMQQHPLGRYAAVIGHVTSDAPHFVQLKTKLGGVRNVDWLVGEQLPRIC